MAWDFSSEGIKRQARRMADLAEKHKQDGQHVVADFFFPFQKEDNYSIQII